jgi:hypothetical protein
LKPVIGNWEKDWPRAAAGTRSIAFCSIALVLRNLWVWVKIPHADVESALAGQYKLREWHPD